jgi:hypothetical protein
MDTSEAPYPTRTIGTQTEQFFSNSSPHIAGNETYFRLESVRDLFSLLIDSFEGFNAIHKRILSTSIYTLLRLVGQTFNSSREILNTLKLSRAQTCQEWCETIMDEDDLSVILRDGRGYYKRITFYESCPELELEAKAFVLESASTIKCSFDLLTLAQFVDKRFRENYSELFEGSKFDSSKLVRSEESCRADLVKWGYRYGKNTCRPYFLGHERDDVVASRKKLVSYLLHNKELYYTVLFERSTGILNFAL